MDGESDGAQAVEGLGQAQSGHDGTAPEDTEGQEGQPQATQQVGTTGAVRRLPDYESQLAEKDAQIQELQAEYCALSVAPVSHFPYRPSA